MIPEDRNELKERIARETYWFRVFTMVFSGISLLLVGILLWLSLAIQVSNRQILTTLTAAIEQGNKQTPAVIQKLEDDIDARSKIEHDQTQTMLLQICKASRIKCPTGRR